MLGCLFPSTRIKHKKVVLVPYRAGALMLILVEVSGRPQGAYPDANPPLLSKNGLFDGRIELKARCLIY